MSVSLSLVSEWELVAGVPSCQGLECFGVSLQSWEGMKSMPGRGEGPRCQSLGAVLAGAEPYAGYSCGLGCTGIVGGHGC